jgi:hypothetical protein
MTIRTVLNPYGGIPPIVDARIGTAYAVVEICVLNLETITEVSNSLDQIQLVYNNMNAIVQVGGNTANINIVAANIDDINLVADRFETEVTSKTYGIAAAIGTPVTVPWPAGVNVDKVLASNVWIKGTNNWLYHPGSTTFVAIGKPTGLEVVVQAGSTNVAGGTIFWHITHIP